MAPFKTLPSFDIKSESKNSKNEKQNETTHKTNLQYFETKLFFPSFRNR